MLRTSHILIFPSSEKLMISWCTKGLIAIPVMLFMCAITALFESSAPLSALRQSSSTRHQANGMGKEEKNGERVIEG